MESRICLIRHGITEGNVRRLYYGKTDIPLADEGIEELKKLAADKVYPDSSKAIIFTSGLIRTIQTKELIYGDREFEVIEDLREINFGEFEMKGYEELLKNANYRDWISAEDLDKAPPGGESIREFNHRVIRGYETVRDRHMDFCAQQWAEDEEAGKPGDADREPGDAGPVTCEPGDAGGTADLPLTIAICHGGTISAIMDHIWPGVHDSMYGWIPDPGHGYLLTLEDDEVTGHELF